MEGPGAESARLSPDDPGAIGALLEANADYAAGLRGADFAAQPRRSLAIVTCMDARIDPAAAFGLAPGDAHVIRNAGGNAREALRSLVISQRMLGTGSVALIKHTDCGMEGLKVAELETRLVETGADVAGFDWYPFSDLERAVRDELSFLRSSPLIAARELRGFVYETATARLREVGA